MALQNDNYFGQVIVYRSNQSFFNYQLTVTFHLSVPLGGSPSDIPLISTLMLTKKCKQVFKKKKQLLNSVWRINSLLSSYHFMHFLQVNLVYKLN